MNLEPGKEEGTNDRARGARPSNLEGGVPRRLLLLLAFLATLTAAGLLGLDRIVAQAVDKYEPGWLLVTSKVVSMIGGIGIYPIAAGLLLVWSWRVRPDRWLWRACIGLLTAEAIASLVVRVLKIVFGRWRPGQVLGGQFEFFDLRSKCHSFPSGHTADAAAVATVLWFVYPRLRPLYVAWVLLMALARVGAMQHFVADAATGAALGILCALVVGRNLDAMERWIGRHLTPGPADGRAAETR